MDDLFNEPHSLACSCGQIELPVSGGAIMSVICYCSSCQEAADRLASPASLMKKSDGGTPFVLYRKDVVDCSKAAEWLYEHRLTAESSTRRVFSVCCNSPMFLEFNKGHWLSAYSARVPEALRPPPALRTMVKDAPQGTAFTDAIPSYSTHSPSFMLRLFWAWVKMGFRAPPLEVRGVRSASVRQRSSQLELTS